MTPPTGSASPAHEHPHHAVELGDGPTEAPPHQTAGLPPFVAREPGRRSSRRRPRPRLAARRPERAAGSLRSSCGRAGRDPAAWPQDQSDCGRPPRPATRGASASLRGPPRPAALSARCRRAVQPPRLEPAAAGPPAAQQWAGCARTPPASRPPPRRPPPTRPGRRRSDPRWHTPGRRANSRRLPPRPGARGG